LSNTRRLQPNVQHRFLVQGQNDARTDVARKSSQLNRYFVGANRQIRNAEPANLICKDRAADIRFDVSRCDHRSGNDCLLRIHNRTRDCSRRGLSEQTNRKYRESQYTDKQTKTHPYVHDFSLIVTSIVTSGTNHLEEIPMSSGGESLSYFP